MICSIQKASNLETSRKNSSNEFCHSCDSQNTAIGKTIQDATLTKQPVAVAGTFQTN